MDKYIGFDMHTKRTATCVYDPASGTRRRETIRTDLETMKRWLRRQRKKGDRLHLTFEVGTEAGYFYDGLRGEVDSLKVSNPSQMTWIFRTSKKNDGIDAEKQAILLALGETPEVHMSCVEVREWRALIRHRGRLVEDQTRCKNRIRAHLRVRHLKKPYRSHWWSARNREWMWTQAREGTSPWHLKLTSLLQQLELLEGQVAEVTDRLDERAKGDARIELLKTIPGIGPRAAEALVAYTDDINRFSHCKKFASYFGVTPKLDESGDTRRLGHINKRGPTVVRWYLTEGCWRAIRRSPALAAFYHRVQHGRPDRKKVALIAVVRKVLTIIYAMLKTGTCFNEELVIAQLAEAA